MSERYDGNVAAKLGQFTTQEEEDEKKRMAEELAEGLQKSKDKPEGAPDMPAAK